MPRFVLVADSDPTRALSSTWVRDLAAVPSPILGHTWLQEDARPADVKDPTGCGDAYRAGLLYGLLNDMKWEDTGRLASLLGAIKVASLGTQNHSFTSQSLDDAFESNFGYRLGL